MRPTTTSRGFQPNVDEESAYEAPVLIEIGGVYELTLTGGHGGCWHDKKWGGSDGIVWTIHGVDIPLPISSC